MLSVFWRSIKKGWVHLTTFEKKSCFLEKYYLEDCPNASGVCQSECFCFYKSLNKLLRSMLNMRQGQLWQHAT